MQCQYPAPTQTSNLAILMRACERERVRARARG